MDSLNTRLSRYLWISPIAESVCLPRVRALLFTLDDLCLPRLQSYCYSRAARLKSLIVFLQEIPNRITCYAFRCQIYFEIRAWIPVDVENHNKCFIFILPCKGEDVCAAI